MENKKVTIKELIEISGVKRITVNRRIKDGTIITEKPDGYHTLIDLKQFEGKDLKTFLLRRKRNSEETPTKNNLLKGNIAIECSGNLKEILNFLEKENILKDTPKLDMILQSKFYFFKDKRLCFSHEWNKKSFTMQVIGHCISK